MILRKMIIIYFFLTLNALAIESHTGFVVSAFDDRFKVISPEKFRTPMEVVVENNTLVRLVGKVMVNHKANAGFVSIESGKYTKIMANLKKGDILHFIPLSPAFQEVELIVGNKNYEIPPAK